MGKLSLKQTRVRVTAAVAIAAIASIGVLVGSSGAANGLGPTNKTHTFYFTNTTNNKSTTLFNVDGLLVNARCSPTDAPVIFAFTSAAKADLLGHVIDGSGNVHVIANDAFTSKSKGVSLAPAIKGDFDAAGVLNFEANNGKAASVVTVNYSFDNKPTLANQNVCTVYGSLTAS